MLCTATIEGDKIVKAVSALAMYSSLQYSCHALGRGRQWPVSACVPIVLLSRLSLPAVL